MARSLALALPLGLLALPGFVTLAQSPSPAGETGRREVALWTGEDAMTWWWLQDAAATLKSKGPTALPHLHGGHGDDLLPGFVGTLFTYVADGDR